MINSMWVCSGAQVEGAAADPGHIFLVVDLGCKSQAKACKHFKGHHLCHNHNVHWPEQVTRASPRSIGWGGILSL